MRNGIYLFTALVCFLSMDATLKKGQSVADFQLFDELGQVHRLSQYRGKKVALIFYPK
jgi:peroxiredoxin